MLSNGKQGKYLRDALNVRYFRSKFQLGGLLKFPKLLRAEIARPL